MSTDKSPDPGYRSPRFPVSVKGVAVQDGRVLLLENERAEWAGLFTRQELPTLPMPDGYRRSIADWLARLAD